MSVPVIWNRMPKIWPAHAWQAVAPHLSCGTRSVTSKATPSKAKVIGLIGGMSWESSALYYRRINQLCKEALGGHHSARSLLLSVDFAEVEALQAKGAWNEAGVLLATAAQQLQAGGAEMLVLCTNTMHKVADQIQDAVPSMPFIHIADPTAKAVKKASCKRIGLLGTRYTMEGDFYRGRLQSNHGLDVIVPCESDRGLVHNIIYKADGFSDAQGRPEKA